MATTLKEGNQVTFADREATAEDAKSQLFYDFYRGLTGKILKVYPTDEIAVEIDQDSLPSEVSLRHREMQAAEMKKWLDGLSEEGRNRLTPKERDFKLRYSLLVSANDLTLG